jgi:ligand-binding sensor domain-containing protein
MNPARAPGSTVLRVAHASRASWFPGFLSVFLFASGLPGAPALAARPFGNLDFRRVAVPDGVPADLVSALAQDQQGFLWVGTQGGLLRYDGHSFRLFKPEPDDPRSLGGIYVRALLPSSDGRLWVGTFSGGLSVFDPVSETFARYQHAPSQPGSLTSDRVEGLAEDGHGRIWIATGEGLDVLDPATGALRHFRHDPAVASSLADDRVRGLLADREGRLWVGTRGGLQRWRGATSDFVSIPLGAGGAEAGLQPYVAKLFEDSHGRLWVGTVDQGVILFDPPSGLVTRLPLAPAEDGLGHPWVYGLAESPSGAIWVGTFGGGLDVFDPDSLRVVERFRPDAAVPTSIPGDRVGALLRDRSGTLWVGTWGQGLALVDPEAPFRSVRYSPIDPSGLSHPAPFRPLALQDGSVWVGTSGNGIDTFDGEGVRTGGFRPDPAQPGALADGSITSLLQTPDGAVWVGCLEGALQRLRPGAAQFETLPLAPGQARGTIRALARGPDGALWAGTAEGLVQVDPAAFRTVAVHRQRPLDDSSLSSSTIESLAFTSDGTLWVGTDNGLNAFDPRTGRAVRVLHDPLRKDSLPNNWVPDLLVARDGRLWAATQGGAAILTSWDGRTARFEQAREKVGRPAAPVLNLAEDATGQIWLEASLRLDPRAWTAQDFGPADGCDPRGFWTASHTRLRDGTLLFGAHAGLLAVRPERVRPWTFEPQVVLGGAWIDGQPLAGASKLEKVTLLPGMRSLRLDLAVLDLTAPARSAWRAQLEGFDPDPVAASGGDHTLSYAWLPPGDYTLRVQGANRAGRYGRHELRLPVEVVPALHQRLWFRALSVLGAAGLIALAVVLRLRTLETRGRELESLVQARTKELAEKNAQLEQLAVTDPLTGLANRRSLMARLDDEVARARRWAW